MDALRNAHSEPGLAASLATQFERLDPSSDTFAVEAIDLLLHTAYRLGASDIHFQPWQDSMEVRFRLDGVLHRGHVFPVSIAPNLIARLKVLAGLLTYQTDTAQEGHLRKDGFLKEQTDDQIQMRLSTFPTLFGERAIVRVFSTVGKYQTVPELGFPKEVEDSLCDLLRHTAGAILATGPAGSGKTTTIYACLRELVHTASLEGDECRSIISIEDPIEMVVEGVAQSQVNPRVGLDLAGGLRFLMRQDPEVILVGEIRDAATAEAAFRASLTGHLLLTTFHAGSAAEAISRLSDMGIEPYLLRSCLLGILSQRLVRRLCECATWSEAEEDRLGLPLERSRVAQGCPKCNQTGYTGRVPLAELLLPARDEVGRAILSREESTLLEQLAVKAGMVSLRERALDAVRDGVTSAVEVRRILGSV
ncbi:MAG: GspE/PulE family protein [Planctomycetia bacterium]|jgi:type II secretory ATPase GspE/PulE/Tfp pilus assembly ATPase PilB-like protein